MEGERKRGRGKGRGRERGNGRGGKGRENLRHGFRGGWTPLLAPMVGWGTQRSITGVLRWSSHCDPGTESLVGWRGGAEGVKMRMAICQLLCY